MAFVHNPTHSDDVPLIAEAVEAIMANLPPTKAAPLVSSLLEVEGTLTRDAIMTIASENGLKRDKLEEILSVGVATSVIQDHIHFSRRVLELAPGQTALLSNGKVLCV